MGRQAQKTQLELYLDEPRVDRDAKLDMLAFWKENEFQHSYFYCCFEIHF